MDTATSSATATRPGIQPAPEVHRKIAIICSKGSLDMAYPGLILANAARMNGIEVMMFFTFWGLDIVNEKKLDDLHMQMVGNPATHMPPMLAGLPGIEHMATKMMMKEMQKLDIPGVREFLQILEDSGADLYACKLAMDMFKLEKKDLVPGIKDVLSAGEFFDKAEGAQIIFI